MKIKLIVAYIIIFILVVSIKALAQDTIKSAMVPELPGKEFDHKAWGNASFITVPVSPQNIINPALKVATVSSVKVKSINDGKTISFLLEWVDSTRNALVDVNRFSDQVAIQFPVDPSSYPSFMMGNQNGRVQIIHWKALWQDDIEKGYTDVKSVHPNYWTDLYYFQDKTADSGSYAMNSKVENFSSKEAKNYMHGAYAGNPMSIFDRKNPSEEAIAEGYGTLTTQPIQNAFAWGKWENNTWRVILSRPIKSEDTSDAVLGYRSMMAFAVWDGQARNIGAIKHYSMWVILDIER